MVIEKKIHFVWIGSEKYPEKYNKFINSFKDKNPDFDIKIWYEADIMKLFDHPDLSKYKDKWMNLEMLIMKCDLARPMILHTEGGIYVDMDFVCYKNLSTLIEGRDLLVTREAHVHNDCMCNGIYGGKKGHKFFTGFLDFAYDKIEKTGKRPFYVDVFSYVTVTTGPMSFYKYVISGDYEYIDNCCLVAPSQGYHSIVKECVKDGIVKPEGNYHEVIGNYTDTFFVDGTGYQKKLSAVEYLGMLSRRLRVNFWILILLLLLVIAIIVYLIYRVVI